METVIGLGSNIFLLNDYNLNIPLYVEKVIEVNLPSVEEALANLKEAWAESQKAEERFIDLLSKFQS